VTDLPDQPTILLRAEEVAILLGLGRTKVFEMLATGELPTVRIGRCVRIPRRELDHWVQARTQPQYRGEPPA
jgi:excisionase family DNA binding protein